MTGFHAGRRLALGVMAGAAMKAWAGPSLAGEDMKLICPFPPGGSADFIARALARDAARTTGAGIIVENVPGAGGVVGTTAAVKGVPGKTLLLGSSGPLAVTPVLRPEAVTYDPQRDLSVVTVVALLKNVVVVRSDARVRDFREFSARLKAEGKRLNYGSSGVGTMPHLAGELMTRMAGLDAANIPYKGNAPAVTDLIAGQIDMAVLDYLTVAPFLQDGRLRAIAVTSAERLSSLPDVPSLAQQGLEGFDMKAWYGVFAPAATPAATVVALNAAFTASLREPAMQQRMRELGLDPVNLDLEGSRRFWASEDKRWRELIPKLGLKLS